MKCADQVFTLGELMVVVVAITALLGPAQSVRADDASTDAGDPGYFGAVKAYADTMLSKGGDTYGQEHSPLFAAALDRKTMELGSAKRFGKIPGVRGGDRSIGGANPQEDKTLCVILYRLSELTGEKQYAAEADKALKYFWTHCQSPETGLMAWGEHLYWDFEKEACAGRGDQPHEINGSWPLWDRSYALAPEACWRFAIGQWDHQVADKSTGDFSRHARWSRHGPGKGADFPRYAGQMITCWADAYSRRENAGRERRDELVTAIRTLVGRMEANMKRSKSGYLPALRGAGYAWSGSNLELARCLWVAAPSMDGELAERMRALALRQDTDFHRMPHRITEGGGFASTLDTRTGEPRHRSMNKPYTAVWATGYGHGMHAAMALRCLSRYHQLRETHGELAGKYQTLILAAADRYLDTLPDVDKLVKPGALAEVIDLLVATHELTGDAKYLQRADRFGRLSLELFIDDTSPLPKATNRHDHYEAITAGIELMRSLLGLHEVLAGSKKGIKKTAEIEMDDIGEDYFNYEYEKVYDYYVIKAWRKLDKPVPAYTPEMVAKHTELVAKLPWVSPTASADENMVLGQTPGWPKNPKFPDDPKIPSLPIYGYRITDPDAEGEKVKMVLAAQNHPIEFTGSWVLEAR